MAQVPAEDIREGDIIDIKPILDDSTALPWDFSPGLDEAALDGARMVAEHEHAVAGDSEVKGDKVALYTDQMNFVLPFGYLVERKGSVDD